MSPVDVVLNIHLNLHCGIADLDKLHKDFCVFTKRNVTLLRNFDSKVLNKILGNVTLAF